MTTTETQISAQRVGGLRPERAGTVAPALADNERDLMLEVDVLDAQYAQLPRPHPGVEQQPDHRSVTTVLEGVALARNQQCRQRRIVRIGTGCSGTDGGLIRSIGERGISPCSRAIVPAPSDIPLAAR
nr:hypothetical protein [Jatrophihabitans sp. GAS493]